MPKLSLSGVAYVIVILVFMLVVVVAWGFISLYSNDMQENYDKNRLGVSVGDLIDFQFHSRYEVDTSGIRGRFRIVDNTPFTYFGQIGGIESWNGAFNSFADVRIEYEDFDFRFEDYPENFFIYTFGRELLEMESVWIHPHAHYVEVNVTFAEEYQGDVLFLYAMDKTLIEFGHRSELYIMNGEEKVYIGDRLHHLNRIIPLE
ncbi:MAG: hypothetical protein FWG87_06790 [Defluviitaleaceae bacterium]|nr:hypothetical protein [Defluviitaleaceae bacterium]